MTRLHRSELCVPGSNPAMLEKAPALNADYIMLDLEDAVAPDDKAQARKNVIAALEELDWRGTSLSLRINGLDTHYAYRDIVDVIEKAGRHLHTVLIPKASCAADIHLVATLLSQIEDAIGLERRLGISVLIETALGMYNVDEIAAAAPDRMEAMIFGVADFAASMQSHTTSIGGPNPDYSILTDDSETGRERHWGDQWHYALARIAVAARANGLRPVDGPFGDFGDPDGYVAAARRALALGFEGKWAIHPSQVALANEVFTPEDALIQRTRRIVSAMEEAATAGRGAVSLDGRLIDAASLRQAEHLLKKVEQIEQIEARQSASRSVVAQGS